MSKKQETINKVRVNDKLRAMISAQYSKNITLPDGGKDKENVSILVGNNNKNNSANLSQLGQDLQEIQAKINEFLTEQMQTDNNSNSNDNAERIEKLLLDDAGEEQEPEED